MSGSGRRIVWTPDPSCWQTTRMGRFLTRVAEERGLDLPSYQAAWRWSIEDLAGFWEEITREFNIDFSAPPVEVLRGTRVDDAQWFSGARLNYARILLSRGPNSAVAIISESQSRSPQRLTFGELRADVARCRTALRSLGVGEGDRVAAYLPNCPEAVVAFLATASLGAVWSSCAPEFGTRAVVDRFAQIAPKVLIAVTGYRYGVKDIDRTADLQEVVHALPTLQDLVILDYSAAAAPAAALETLSTRVSTYAELMALHEAEDLDFVEVPFDHELYVLYSSGSTGLPKPIVHGHGGILLEHLKALGLHHDIGEQDTFFWFTTTGWMMWNYLVSALALGSTIVLFDGDPSHPALDETFRIASRSGTTVLGCGSPYLSRCASEDLTLPADCDLSAVRQIGATGSPLPSAAFDWVADRFGGTVQTVSISGGTDVCTAVVGGSPLLPVVSGAIQCRLLGAWVDAFDESGNPILGSLGEMVIRSPMPSMPVGLWGDSDGSRIHEAYFAYYDGIWRHGDWIAVAADGSCVITGRSDATLNRGGIRSGTAEYSAITEDFSEVSDSLVVHVEDAEGGDGSLVLFVALIDGCTLDDGLIRRIAAAIRSGISPRHVPDRVIAVPVIPRTISGKKLEVPVKRLLSGGSLHELVARDALADPLSWDALVEAVDADETLARMRPAV
jgi:acetoacetyl-CoA synthetase